jgi:hypothetical protein
MSNIENIENNNNNNQILKKKYVKPKKYNIYIIKNDEQECYIGSSNYFNQRKAAHIYNYKKYNEGNNNIPYCTSYKVLSGNRPCFEVLEYFDDITDLNIKDIEQKYINDLKEKLNVVNINNAYIEDKKKYNCEHSKKSYYKYHNINKQKKLDNYYKNIDYYKSYYQNNKDKFKQYKLKYKSLNNNDIIKNDDI